MFMMDINIEIVVVCVVGIGELMFFVKIYYGGGVVCVIVQYVVMVVVIGVVDVVVVYWVFNE